MTLYYLCDKKISYSTKEYRGLAPESLCFAGMLTTLASQTHKMAEYVSMVTMYCLFVYRGLL